LALCTFLFEELFKWIWLILDKNRGSLGSQLIMGAFDLDLESPRANSRWGAQPFFIQVWMVSGVVWLPHSGFILTG
jgi:hypothetical protein